MKTLRKLAALFCALGMLAPSVAMATFGSTFGDRWTWVSNSFMYSDSNDTWPAAVVPIGCFAIDQVLAGALYNCVTTGTSSAHAGRRESIRSGDILRRVDCHATRDAGAGTGTATLAIYNAEATAGSNQIEMAEMVISYASAIATGELRSFDFNVAASFDGFYALGLKSNAQGTTTGGFGWSCKAFWQGPA